MNILYLHGFGSRFNPDNEKVKALSEIGIVHGIDIDYTMHSDDVISHVSKKVYDEKIDLVIGTSMGGWLANRLGNLLGIPFVSINPAISPSFTLMKHIDLKQDYNNKPISLSESNIKSYEDFKQSGCGLILLDLGDELIDSKQTYEKMKDFFSIKMFDGGSHRFAHINDSINTIKSFYNNSGMIYGLSIF